MYSMKDICNLTGMKYETLKYYCNEGLIPNVKRNEKNMWIYVWKVKVPFQNAKIYWIRKKNCWKKN